MEEQNNLIAERIGFLGGQRHKDKRETWDEYSRRVAETLLKILQREGKFLTDGTFYYYHDKVLGSNFFIGDTDSPFQQYLILYYNFSMADANAQKIYSRLRVLITKAAKTVVLHEFAAIHHKKRAVYIRNNPREIIKMYFDSKGKRQVRVIPNGSEGIIMKSGTYLRDINFDIENDEIQYDSTYIYDLFLNKIEFECKGAFTPAYQRKLLRQYIYSFFFKEIVQRRPILVTQGETGSGKTALMLNIGRMLWGPDFAVYTLPENERDLVNSLVNNVFVVLDNVDDKPPTYFTDLVTSVTTGGALTYRPLYKDPTAESLRIIPTCWLGISSRTPFFNRPDIANRSVVLSLKKSPDREYDSFDFEGEVLKYFEGSWLYLLGDIFDILENLLKNKKNIKMNYRMVEFGNFAVRACKTKEEKREMKRILKASTQAQIEFAAQDRPIIDALIALAEAPQYTWKRIAGEYVVEAPDLFKVLSDDFAVYFKNVNAMGWGIKSVWEILTEKIYADKKLINGKTTYVFGPKKTKKEEDQKSFDM